ncbi:DoxX family protein [Streptomyces sp. XM4193]|uniref:DoxX family protein n=1 Tax=Streptomyces sp. XM4193 TaxID=2929782 RepID=UPI001FFB5241|nr:DoxX family protein [Streptomyces sp. XM4193]MCK1794917.1 DoxX family protein [Streptomyces sp. XM4193]
MDVLVLIGRLLFVPLFLGSAVGHLTKSGDMAQYAAAKGVPAARLAVIGSGLLQLVAGLSLLLGIWPDLGALLLVLFLLPTAVLMHNFWAQSDPGAKTAETLHFQKDLALAGAALMLFAFFAHLGDDLGLTMTGSFFDLS